MKQMETMSCKNQIGGVMEFRHREQYPEAEAAAEALYAEPVIDQAGLATFISQVYGWMFLALLVTAGTAFSVLSSESFFYSIREVIIPLFVGKLFVVFFLAARVHAMSPVTATALFFSYAFVNGLTLSVILAMYTASSAANVFAITAATFGVMAFYGLTTKKDLTSWGSLLFMGLVGCIIASIVNMFIFASGPMAMIVSGIAVFIFVGLIAYDNQMIKETYINGMEATGEGHKYAILAALHLYLDFIALFVHLLQFFGDRE